MEISANFFFKRNDCFVKRNFIHSLKQGETAVGIYAAGIKVANR
jgi:hypothetical protein